MGRIKNLQQRSNGVWYVRKQVPVDLLPHYGSKKEVTKSLGTRSKAEAERRLHAALLEIGREFDEKRKAVGLDPEDEALRRSGWLPERSVKLRSIVRNQRIPVALPGRLDREGSDRIRSEMEAAVSRLPTYADASKAVIANEAERLLREVGQFDLRPITRANTVDEVAVALDELNAEEGQADLRVMIDDGSGEDPRWAIPPRYVDEVEAYLASLFDRDRKSLEALKAELLSKGREPVKGEAEPVQDGSLEALKEAWRTSGGKSKEAKDIDTAIREFVALNGPLPYRDVTMAHAQAYKDRLLSQDAKNQTRTKKWSLLRAMFQVAVDDAKLGSNPFQAIKLRLDDDSERGEPFSPDELAKVLSFLEEQRRKAKGMRARSALDEWWLARVALYTGARIGELCQLRKRHVIAIDGIAMLDIGNSDGRRVKNVNSVRKVPIHGQLIRDGFLSYVEAASDDKPLFGAEAGPMSKRMNARIEKAEVKRPGITFHSFRHTFKSGARLVMGEEWHDALTGHAPKSVGRTYGHYRDLKRWVDKVTFGIETADIPLPS